ncbi:MAG: DUF4268 domain-containing protein [Motiliproteus sp.]
MFSAPILFSNGSSIPLERIPFGGGFDEAWLQNRLFESPDALPLHEIDPGYQQVAPLCMEMQTGAGPVDILYVTPQGRLVIIETKLWRNQEARRAVVGQILDYAQALMGWDYSDLQREVSRRTGIKGNSPFILAQKRFPDIEESTFIDSVSRSLEQSDFMLIIAGDGIRSGAQKIVNFLQDTAHMRFVLAMIEIGVYRIPNQDQFLIQPRVLVETQTVERAYIAGSYEQDEMQSNSNLPNSSDSPKSREDWQREYYRFWTGFLEGLQLDEPDQPIPNPNHTGDVKFNLPAKGTSAWIRVYFSKNDNEVGCFVRISKGAAGEELYQQLLMQREEINLELGIEPRWDDDRKIIHKMKVPGSWPPLDDNEIQSFMRDTLNNMVNVFRPRFKLLADKAVS